MPLESHRGSRLRRSYLITPLNVACVQIKVNRVGPRTLPWGTPEDTEQTVALCPFKTVYCNLDVRSLVNQFYREPGTPN